MTETFATEQLRSIIHRIEHLEEEKAAIAADVREVLAEAKANGFDTKAIRQVIRLRKMERDERSEMQALTELYIDAVEGSQ